MAMRVRVTSCVPSRRQAPFRSRVTIARAARRVVTADAKPSWRVARALVFWVPGSCTAPRRDDTAEAVPSDIRELPSGPGGSSPPARTSKEALAVGAVAVATAGVLLPDAAIAHLGDVVDMGLLPPADLAPAAEHVAHVVRPVSRRRQVRRGDGL